MLNVGRNKLGDDGISVILQELQHNNLLTELSVCDCGLSMKGEELINFVFCVCTSFSKYCYLC